MPTTTIATSNPYWDAVRDHIDPTGSLWRTPTTGGFHQYRIRASRPRLGY